MAFHMANVAYGEDGRRLEESLRADVCARWRPTSQFEAVVDGVDVAGRDLVGLNGVSAHAFCHGKDRVGEASEHAVRGPVLSGAEDAHVPPRPDELGRREQFGGKSPPDVGAFEEGLYDADLVLPEEPAEMPGGTERSGPVGVFERQQVDRAGRRVQRGAGGICPQGKDGGAEAVGGKLRRELEDDAFTAAQGGPQLVEEEQDVWLRGIWRLARRCVEGDDQLSVAGFCRG